MRRVWSDPQNMQKDDAQRRAFKSLVMDHFKVLKDMATSLVHASTPEMLFNLEA